jgi:hypothetical protein
MPRHLARHLAEHSLRHPFMSISAWEPVPSFPKHGLRGNAESLHSIEMHGLECPTGTAVAAGEADAQAPS